MPRQAIIDDGLSLDAKVYRIFKVLCLRKFLHIDAMSSKERDHTKSQLRSVWHSMEACGCRRQIQRLCCSRITANLGREPFARAENGLRGVCRPTGCGAPGLHP
jgi:hypothetical protein